MKGEDDAIEDGETASPDGWAIAPFDEVVDFTKKPRGLKAGESIPFVPMKLISEQGGSISEFEERSKPRGGTYFEEGDLLVARITPCFENGKQGIVRGVPGGWGMATTEVYAMRSDVVSREFLSFYFRWHEVHGRLLHRMEGATGRMRVPKEAIGDLHLPIPPRAEQDRIVEAVESAMAAVEDGAGDVQMANQKASVLRQRVVDAVADVEEDQLQKLGDCLDTPLINGRSVPTAEEGFPVLRLTSIKDGVIDPEEAKIGDWSAAEAKRFLISSGDFLVARGNGSLDLVGRGGLVGNNPPKVAFPDTAIRIQIDNSIISRDYLRLIWDSRLIRKQIQQAARTTAGIYKINQTILKALDIPAPSLEEQQRRVDRTRDQLAEIHQLAATAGKALTSADALRRSILHQAFTGQLVPQDPSDEPVSRALEPATARSMAATNRKRLTVNKNDSPSSTAPGTG